MENNSILERIAAEEQEKKSQLMYARKKLLHKELPKTAADSGVDFAATYSKAQSDSSGNVAGLRAVRGLSSMGEYQHLLRIAEIVYSCDYSQTTTVRLVKKMKEGFEGEVTGQKEAEVAGRRDVIIRSRKSTKASAYSLCPSENIKVARSMRKMKIVAVV